MPARTAAPRKSPFVSGCVRKLAIILHVGPVCMTVLERLDSLETLFQEYSVAARKVSDHQEREGEPRTNEHRHSEDERLDVARRITQRGKDEEPDEWNHGCEQQNASEQAEYHVRAEHNVGPN